MICIQCKKQIIGRTNKRFCSSKCYENYRRPKKELLTRNCDYCQKTYTQTTPQNIYCSVVCKELANKERANRSYVKIAPVKKICRFCGENFLGKRKSSTVCSKKECIQKAKNAYRTVRTPTQTRKAYLKHKYKITINEYENLKLSQNGLCAICNRKKELVVDHCHKTGKVRALLCQSCNKALGLIYDNKEIAKNMHIYLT